MKRYLLGVVLGLLASPLPSEAGDRVAEPAAKQPNFLWLVAEDIGLAPLSCYGLQPEASTPAIDRLAAEGTRFTRAYVTCPVCSPSRSAFMTGMYQTTIGAHNHRSHRDDGYQLPEGVKLLTERMKDAGYFTANIRNLPSTVKWKGTGKTDWNFTPPAYQFDSTRWDDLAAHQPFFAQINFQETHRAFHAPKRADPDKVTLPPYYPDHPIARRDYAAYLDAATELDRKVAEVVDLLAKQVMADSTVVIFFGDNGESMVRGKQFCYEEGLRIPLIIRWPKNFAAPRQWGAGKVDERLIESIDFAPTMLSLVGAPVPAALQGRVVLGEHAAAPREYAFGARDRCDETVFRLRTVCDAGFRYIRNFTPERPFLQPNEYKEKQYPVWNLLKELHAEGKLTPAQEFLCAPTMPAEELYDLHADPHEIHNLAADPTHAATVARLRGALEKWIADTRDQGEKLESENIVRARGLIKPASANPNKGYTVDGGVTQ
jgi:arylsulfatase A-like enzyme